MEKYVSNARLIALAMALILVAGFSALKTLPRSEDPRISNRFGFIFTPFPGASAERVEALVTEKIENKLREIPEIRYINSRSLNGLSTVIIELKDSVYERDTDLIWSRARDLLDQVHPSLPPTAQKPLLDDNRTYAFTLITSLNWVGDEKADLSVLNRYADDLESHLRSVSGTDYVKIYGKIPEEILVEVDPLVAASARISVQQLSQIIFAADTKMSAGKIQNDKFQFSVEVAGELDSLDRIRNIPVSTDQQGNILYVGDIATVSRQQRSPAKATVLVKNKEAVVVAVRVLPDQRVDLWTERLIKELDLYSATLPKNIEQSILFRQDQYTTNRLSDLTDNIIIGFSLILLVLLITLGWRSALIVASALPLTVFFTLACMQFYGLPIHQMSVTGLIVALGIMVDNAIVMVDSIAQLRAAGHSRVESMVKSIKHLWVPLLGSSITTILGFMPIVIMPGPSGEFVGGIALSVIFSLIGSYLISMTIIAGLAGRLLPKQMEQKKGWYHSGFSSSALSNGFKSLLALALKKPVIAMLLVALAPLFGFYCAGTLKQQFFPTADRDMFSIELHLSQQASLDATTELAHQVAKDIENLNGIKSVNWFIGSNAPAFYYNLHQMKDGSNNFAQGMVTAESFQDANRIIPELQKSLNAKYLNAQIYVNKLEQGPPFNAPIELRLYGPNLDVLSAKGRELRKILSTTPEITNTRVTLTEAKPKVWVKLNEEEALKSGLNPAAIANQLQQALDGSYRGSIIEQTYALDVAVRYPLNERNSTEDLQSHYLVTQQDNQGEYASIPISALGDIELKPSRGSIPRRNGKRLNHIEAFIEAGVLPSLVLEKAQKALKTHNFQLPPGYELEIGGEDEKREESVGKLLSSVGIIATMLILVLVLSFNSFRISLIIALSAIQSVGLGLLSIYLFQYPFGFTSIIGLLGLMGLAINAAIVILAELKANESAAKGDPQAIIKGVMSCGRHITSTTITTVGGFLPLILSGGGFWPPFAIAIAGGTVLTTIVSFFFVPAMFMLLARKKHFDIS